MAHGAEAVRREGGVPVLEACHLAWGSDAEDHSRLSARKVLVVARRLLVHVGPYHLLLGAAYPVPDQAACPFLDQEAHPFLTQVVLPFLA